MNEEGHSPRTCSRAVTLRSVRPSTAAHSAALSILNRLVSIATAAAQTLKAAEEGSTANPSKAFELTACTVSVVVSSRLKSKIKNEREA